MRKLITLISVLCFSSIYAQQVPQFTHYLLNQFAYNPAVAGSKECLDVTLGHRSQWTGFEGAPITTFGSFNTTLSQDKFGLGYKHAVGLVILRDSYGPFNRTKLKAAYSYHLPLTRKILLSMGMFVGIEQINFNAQDVTLINYNDNAINNSRRSTIFPEFTPGVFLQSDKWFTGATLQQTIGGKKKAVGTDETVFTRHATLLGGINIKVNNDWSVIPSSLIKISKAAPLAIDVNAMFDYKNRFAIGASYRNTDAVAALINFNIFNYFKVGYSYDYTLSKLRAGGSNTHEISLSIIPCGYKEEGRYGCPTFN